MTTQMKNNQNVSEKFIKNKKITTIKEDIKIAVNQVSCIWKNIVIVGTIIASLFFSKYLSSLAIFNQVNMLIADILKVFYVNNIYILSTITLNNLLCISLIIILLFALSKPRGFNKWIKIFSELKITDDKSRTGNTPIPIKVVNRKGNSKVKALYLYANGVTVEDLEVDDRLKRISQKVRRHVIGVEYHKNDIDKIVIYYKKHKSRKMLIWKPEYLPKEKYNFVLGENDMCGLEILNINVTPHLIIAGSSGSGKSVEMCQILMQGILHGNRVIIGEFSKGGIDFNRYWRELNNCEVYTEIDRFWGCFAYDIKEQLRIRSQLLIMNDCKNIDIYNRKIDKGEIKAEKLQYILIALDEAGQIFLKSKNRDKENTLTLIRETLEEISSVYRFCGISLILSTQIPSATILPEQIRHNAERICARSNKILSNIVIEREDASRISKSQKGRFIPYEGNPFQGFLFSEKDVFNDSLLQEKNRSVELDERRIL